MNTFQITELIIFLIGLYLVSIPLSRYINNVYDGNNHFLKRIISPIELRIYHVCGIDQNEEQNWSQYTVDLIIFSAISMAFTYGILRLQHRMPINPAQQGVIPPHLAFNTAMSFTTNTNWQSYSGESTMSYLSQMVALTLHNFLSAAVGLNVAVALIRGITRKQTTYVGNFWCDLVKGIIYILLPICIFYAVFLLSQGVIQNFLPYTEVHSLEGFKQVIAQGPVASQVAIKMLGTNGGGFFNANAAHPFENPTPLSNFVQIFSIFLIPSALVLSLGAKTKSKGHANAVWAVMAILFVIGLIGTHHFEKVGNPILTHLGAKSAENWEGKELRFGIFDSALFATATTAASCGAVNAMHDSFTPLGGMFPMINMMLGEIIYGGVGAGLYGMMTYILLTVFIAGLMIGRTPEYFGKKIEAREMKFVMISLIVMALCILGFTAWGVLDSRGIAGLANNGFHGFSEILYAYTSAAANNGSAFAGLSANTPFWNLTLAFVMFFGRFFMLIPIMAIAGSLANKKITPAGSGTFPVEGVMFGSLLFGVVILVGALTFFPALTLGPIAEHLQMLSGKATP